LQNQNARFERYSAILLGFLACLLTLPALKAGLLGDDYIHRAVLLHRGELAPFMSPVMDLFAFVKPGEPADVMRGLGYLPWWSDPAIRISLFRPVTALTHILDYALWPDGIALQHLHSLCWFFLGVAVVAALYRMIPDTSLRTAALAGLLFAVEDAHAYPAGWIANRNALLCLVFGTAALMCHLRWRASGSTRWLVLALLLFSAGLGCGEATLGVLGYIVAWQLTMEHDRPRIRSLSAVSSYAGVILLWWLTYDALGYGVTGSSLYVDPAQRPHLFLRALVERWPVLFAGQWLQLPTDAWLLLTENMRVVVALASVALAAGVVTLLWPLRNRPVARFWAIGMTLSIVPLCAAFPMERLLLFPGIGAFGLLALFVDSHRVSSPPDRWRRRTAIALLVLHGPIAAVLLTGKTLALPTWGEFFSAAVRRSTADSTITARTFIYVNGNDFPVVYSRIIPIANGDPAPGRVAQLASMTDSTLINRQDLNTLIVTPRDGFLAHPIDRLLASDERAFSLGERIDRPDYQVNVLDVTRDGRPASVSFQFRRPLEDPSYRWLCWRDRRLQTFDLPQVGASIVIPENTLSPF
jgi:hypothetical protein